nr:hypothetical protein BAR15_10023 [Bartonella sp. AR 15-3]
MSFLLENSLFLHNLAIVMLIFVLIPEHDIIFSVELVIT